MNTRAVSYLADVKKLFPGPIAEVLHAPSVFWFGTSAGAIDSTPTLPRQLAGPPQPESDQLLPFVSA